MDKINVIIGGVNVELEKEEVSKAIETGELKIESDDIIAKSDDVVVRTKEDFESFTRNLANDEHKAGRLKGIEIYNKKLKEVGGWDFEGKSVLDRDGNIDIEATAKMFAPNIEAVLGKKSTEKPNEIITELQADKKKLQENYSSLEQEYLKYKSNQTEKEKRAEKDNKYSSFIPSEGLKVSAKLAMLGLKDEGIDIDIDENNNAVVIENGKVIKDSKSLNPVDPSLFIKEKIAQLGWLETMKTKTNGKDETGKGTATSYDLFVEEMAKQDVSPGTLKFSQEMAKRQKEKTLVI